MRFERDHQTRAKPGRQSKAKTDSGSPRSGGQGQEERQAGDESNVLAFGEGAGRQQGKYGRRSRKTDRTKIRRKSGLAENKRA
jgi:hypothetical protein